MEQLSLSDAVEWGDDDKGCTLCEHADDAGSAMAYLKQMDTALGGRTTDARLAQMMLESYNTFFRNPMLQAGQQPSMPGARGTRACRGRTFRADHDRIPYPHAEYLATRLVLRRLAKK